MGNGSKYEVCISIFSQFSRLRSCIVYTYLLAEFRYIIDSRMRLDLFVSLLVFSLSLFLFFVFRKVTDRCKRALDIGIKNNRNRE